MSVFYALGIDHIFLRWQAIFDVPEKTLKSVKSLRMMFSDQKKSVGKTNRSTNVFNRDLAASPRPSEPVRVETRNSFIRWPDVTELVSKVESHPRFSELITNNRSGIPTMLAAIAQERTKLGNGGLDSWTSERARGAAIHLEQAVFGHALKAVAAENATVPVTRTQSGVRAKLASFVRNAAATFLG